MFKSLPDGLGVNWLPLRNNLTAARLFCGRWRLPPERCRAPPADCAQAPLLERWRLICRPVVALRVARIPEAVEHGRKVRPVLLHPLDRDCGVEPAGFGEFGLRVIHPAGMRVGGGPLTCVRSNTSP